jgi:ADP-ribose pyrophosphatase YjhB (NUDIX family)
VASSGTSRPTTSGDLLAHPRPSLAVDVAVLTVAPLDPADEPRLAVLLLRRDAAPKAGAWSLPGSFVRERERLADAVLRTLADKCGIGGLAPRQLHVFDDPARDDRGWVVSVAHTDVVPADRLAPALADRDDLILAPVASAVAVGVGSRSPVELPGRQASLPFDHAQIVALAVHDLRERYQATPDPAGLLPEPFTFLALRRTHEAVLGEPQQKDTFRRRMLPLLVEDGEIARGGVGRPAQLYRRAAAGPPVG